MLSRRRALQGGLAAAGAFLTPFNVSGQTTKRTTVRYNQVVRSILYTPAYAAIANGFFEEVGIEVALETGQGGDKTVAAVISGRADIGLIGPESAIYVKNSESREKIKIFCGLTATDGYYLVGREKVEKFDWKMLKGKEVMGRNAGTTPQLYLEWAMRQNGLDPRRDVKFNNNIAVPARAGAWVAGQSDYAIFIEPEASQLELSGKTHFLASVGKTVGMVDYTVFQATEKFIEQNRTMIQNWTNAIYKGQKWTASASIAEIVKVQEKFFPGVSPQVLAAASERYRTIRIWKESPLVEEKAIETFQDILVQGGVLEAGKRVKYQDVVVADFAKKAMAR